MKRFVLLLAALSLLPGVPAGAAQPARGAWTTGDCADTKIVFIGPRLGGEHDSAQQMQTEMRESGISVQFGTHRWPKDVAEVVHYQGDQQLAVMSRERVGDRVQLCLVSRPKKDQYCDPTTDRRGVEFRVYDYRLRQSYSGINSEHGCGGA